MVNEEKRHLFRNSAFLEYFGMNLSSGTSGAVVNVAVVWFVFEMTRSALDVAVVGFAVSISAVVTTLPAGVWIDRFDRRLLLLAANALRAVGLCLLAVLTASFGFELSAVVILVSIWSAAGELYRSTDYSVLPELVEADEVADANGVTRAGHRMLSSASYALGGALVALAGILFTLLYSAAGYMLASAFSVLLLLRYRRTAAKDNAPRRSRGMMLSEIREGMRWLVGQRGLFQLSLSAVVFNFMFGLFYYFIVVYVGLGLKAGPLLFGLILAANVTGQALGSLLVGRTNALAHTGKVWLLLNGALTGALILSLGLFTSGTFALSALFLMGLSTGFGDNVWLSSAQNLVPKEMRGRYFAIDGLLSFAGGPPAVAVGGVLIAMFGVLRVYLATGAILLVSALLFTSFGSLWRLDGRLSRRGQNEY